MTHAYLSNEYNAAKTSVQISGQLSEKHFFILFLNMKIDSLESLVLRDKSLYLVSAFKENVHVMWRVYQFLLRLLVGPKFFLFVE